ncbi:GWxTD domain-containing protein [Cyclobacterium lianum]|uniref:GWxTD domain-containing protein n=1 Tax=Cyclobacterium lianum TaxID=388280 RepID=A0A1M7PDB1_9BACT|nr:GWxTD domain-containing protein [Cyclobacterium lianum]SHN14924.1 GWxTD domain-containing protein [Cyclobacterium lianum]
MKKILGCLAVFCFLSLSVHAQNNLQSLNQNLRYSRYSRISLKVIPIKTGERTFTLQMVAEKIEEDPDFDNYLFSYTIVSSFQQNIEDEQLIALDRDLLKADTDRHFYFEETVDIPVDQEEAYVVFRALDTRQQDEYVFHADLISPFVSGQPGFGAYYGNDIPFDQNFLNVDESLLFKSNRGVNLHHYYYPGEFPLPLPPMETKTPEVPRETEIVDEGSFLVNVPVPFKKAGYYFIQADTSSSVGMMIKTASQTFPRVATWEEMIQMVTYISTRKEHETLLAAENKKLALDEYWIRMTRDEEIAKSLIKEYFRQVEFANILFTDFKEGWATDRGMVYIVMGPPQEVYFDKDKETWVYLSQDSNSKITFTFARIKNILTPNYYTLNRSRAYQPIWFKNITAWRNGRMVF